MSKKDKSVSGRDGKQDDVNPESLGVQVERNEADLLQTFKEVKEHADKTGNKVALKLVKMAEDLNESDDEMDKDEAYLLAVISTIIVTRNANFLRAATVHVSEFVRRTNLGQEIYEFLVLKHAVDKGIAGQAAGLFAQMPDEMAWQAAEALPAKIKEFEAAKGNGILNQFGMVMSKNETIH